MSSSQPAGINKSAQKILRVLYCLRGHYLFGVSNKDLALSLNESPSQITRALQTLESEGWVEKRENGNYAPTVKTVRFAVSCQEEHERIQARFAEYQNRLQRSH